MTKKIMSTILAIIAVFGLMSSTAAAAETKPADAHTVSVGMKDEVSSDISLPENPMDQAAINRVFAYAAVNGLTQVSVAYTIPYKDEYKATLKTLLSSAQNEYAYSIPEYFNYTRKLAYTIQKTSDGFTLNLTWSARSVDTQAMLTYRAEAFAQANQVYTSLVNAGAIKAGMTQKEVALVLLNWVCDNTTYKNENNELCHTAYSVFIRGIGVCDAYTSAYNTLLKLAGIECWGVKGIAGGETHLWTVAVLDGEQVNIDATWCDSAKVRTMYFGLDDATFALTHEWARTSETA